MEYTVKKDHHQAVDVATRSFRCDDDNDDDTTEINCDVATAEGIWAVEDPDVLLSNSEGQIEGLNGADGETFEGDVDMQHGISKRGPGRPKKEGLAPILKKLHRCVNLFEHFSPCQNRKLM